MLYSCLSYGQVIGQVTCQLNYLLKEQTKPCPRQAKFWSYLSQDHSRTRRNSSCSRVLKKCYSFRTCKILCVKLIFIFYFLFLHPILSFLSTMYVCVIFFLLHLEHHVDGKVLKNINFQLLGKCSIL